MSDLTPAGELTAAAEKIRKLAEAATAMAGGPDWTADHHPEGTIVRPAASHRSLFVLHADGGRAAGTPCVYPAVGAWIAAMHPGVGLALAGWLEAVGGLHEAHRPGLLSGLVPSGCQWCADEDWPCADMRHALAVARAVLGSET